MALRAARTRLVALAALLLAVSVLAKPERVLTLPGSVVEFDQCMLIEGIGSGFNLLWTLEPNGTDGQWMRVGWNSSAAGYAAFGFPPNPEPDTGAMIGATVLSLQSCKPSITCPTGAQVVQWFLGGTSSGEMSVADTLQTRNTTASALPGGGMAASLYLLLPADVDPAEQELIFGAGAVYGNGGMRKHQTYGISALDLTTGTLLEDPEQNTLEVSAMVTAHLWLMLVGWGFLIPIGIVMARCLKSMDPFWFKAHRAIQTTGLVMGLVGFGLGFAIAGGWTGRFVVHRNLGIAATVLGVLQASAVFLRPKLTSPRRRGWNLYHWWQGRAAVACAVANIYYGLINMEHLGTGAVAGYSAVFSVIVASAIAMDGWGYLQLPPPGQKVHSSSVALAEKQLTNGHQFNGTGHASGSPFGAHSSTPFAGPSGITPESNTGTTTPGDATPARFGSQVNLHKGPSS